MTADDRRAWLQLIRTPGLGPVRTAALLDVFGSAADIIAASTAAREAAGVPRRVAQAISQPADELDADERWLDAAPNRHLIAWDDARYPDALRRLDAPPPALFVVGDPEVLATAQVAMVGSRNPTPQGRDNATAFARSLAARGLTITSGLALGIDGAAHQGALDAGGLTVAVCGTGLDRVYPATHRALAHAIVAEGALVSEYPPGIGPRAEHFPRRNRIISGLALGVIVVEAATESGSLITARHAMEQNREVFAIPGSIHNVLARGCHRLIRDGAKLVETGDDVLEELAVHLPAATVTGAPTAASEHPDGDADTPTEMDADYRALLDALGDSPATVDDLVQRTALTAEAVSSMLLVLELDGRVATSPGGRFMRRASAP